MSSLPNKFNLHGDAANQSGPVPNEMIQNSEMVQSAFITSDHTNQGDMFSSSPSFTYLQNSDASSSSSGFNNSAYHQMTRNISSVSGTDYFPLNNNPHLTQVSFTQTQTITNSFTALVPTNTLGTTQFDMERVNHGMDYESNFVNPTFHRPNVFDDDQCEILNPEPLSVIYPDQDEHVPQYGRYVKKTPEPAKIFEKPIDLIDLEEDGENEDDLYDGRTHSLPYEKYGPYTCPKCNGVFDSSQKFAAHMPSHYKNETRKEKIQRFHAKNQRKYQKLSNEVHGESQNMKEEPI
ncbi:hypothetical protein V5N11_008940 [Cardamine amara subsp. amara]|uniref:C2H2-type domain-containing protein n=1 Tax=Cardamine amara subsp. amara TaxID=228776 RepID=A0ABD1BIL3_CARAN